MQPYGEIYGLVLPRNSLVCGPLHLCPAILLANKRVHCKASPLLYSSNGFRLDKGYLTLFLDHIGPQNTSFLYHICIAFPAFNNYHHLESVTLKKDSIRTLERIRDNCTNLATLEMLPRFWTINIIESTIDAPDSPQSAALALVLPHAGSSFLLQSPECRLLTYAPKSSLVLPMPPDAPEAYICFPYLKLLHSMGLLRRFFRCRSPSVFPICGLHPPESGLEVLSL